MADICRLRRLLGRGRAVVSVQILGHDNASLPRRSPPCRWWCCLAKVAGLYDRDELVLDKSTLEEAPKLFHAATLYALLVWLGESYFVTGVLGPLQVLGIWGLLFACSVVGRSARPPLRPRAPHRPSAACSSATPPPRFVCESKFA